MGNRPRVTRTRRPPERSISKSKRKVQERAQPSPALIVHMGLVRRAAGAQLAPCGGETTLRTRLQIRRIVPFL